MYITAVPNRSSPPAILLRESYRDNGKVKTRTLANLTAWAPARVEALRQVLQGVVSVGAPLQEAFEIVRSRPHGHVAAALGTLERLKLDHLLSAKRCRERDLAVALITARILRADSKLATSRALSAETMESTLGECLDIDPVDEDDLYAAMDWLLERQPAVEKALAKRHLAEGGMVLYDLTSTYFEGHSCPLAKLGYARDGKRGKLQIEFGLLTNAEGCPVAVEVFEGNIGDPQTLASQVKKLRERFGIERLVLVGDRGMITDARIREDLVTVEGVDWITALRTPAIRKLVESRSLQLSLFDKKDLAEITDPAYPGERLIVCKNPLLAEERARKRSELLAATEKDLRQIKTATERGRHPLRGQKNIALRVGKALGRYKVGKHFVLTITDQKFDFKRDQRAIDEEASLDGFYVIRTSVGADRLDAVQTVRTYKQLSRVERAFRSLKTVDLHVRPIYHHSADRVRAHVWLCMLAFYVEWHMRRDLAPLLFDDHQKAEGEMRRASVVAPAQRSHAADAKAQTKRTEDGQPVHSFQSLLRDLATIVKNSVEPKAGDPFDVVTRPTALQSAALKLLRVSLRT
jgi:transposase